MNSRNQKPVAWNNIGILFSTFAVIVLISVFCFSFYKTSMLGKALQNNVIAMQQQVKALQTDQENVRQEFQQSSEALKQVTGTVQQQLQGGDKNTWRMVEAKYYVNLADTTLRFKNDIPAAIDLLKLADQQVQGLNDPRFDPLRKALAEDIVKLQSVPALDYTGIYLRLTALDQQIDSLPLLTKPSAENTVQPVAQTDASWWQKGLQETWSGLQKIIVIRYSAVSVPPLMTPDQQIFLRQNLHSMLQQAMWAVLNKNSQIYQVGLQQTSSWIRQYFVTASAVTENELTSLNQLQQIDIHPAIPQITGSLQAFHDY